MKHHVLAAAMGLLTAALLAPSSQSQAATTEPLGFWTKPDSERNAKMQITRCGRGLCAKIVWIEDPNDSQGKPLRDVRNANPSMRGRSILGLPIFSGLIPAAGGTWTGKIYNPEDGNTYSVTLTVASRSKLILKGCKNWLMCGERVWIRTSPPPATPKPEEQIEASAEPDSAPAGSNAAAAAASLAKSESEPAPASLAKAEPEPAPAPLANVEMMATPAGPAAAPSADVATASPLMSPAQPSEVHTATDPVTAAEEPQSTEAPKAQLVTHEPAPATHNTRSGFQFLNASAGSEDAAHLSGDNVTSMIVMTKPIATDTVAPPAGDESEAPVAATAAARAATQASVVPTPKPRAVSQASAAAAAKPASEAKQQANGAPLPRDGAIDQAGAMPPALQADAALAEPPPPLTRRQRRMLRRQQQEQFLPWLR